MKVVMRTNLGSRDAVRVGLKIEDCTSGSTVYCSEEAGKWLVSRGLADPVDTPSAAAPEPKEEVIKAVPEEPKKAAPPSVMRGKK